MHFVILVACLITVQSAKSSGKDDDNANPAVCQDLGSISWHGDIREAIMDHKPFRVPMREILGEVDAEGHWEIFEDKDCFDLAISRDGVFFGTIPEETSPIGLRRVAPALLECVSWKILKRLIKFLSQEDASAPVPKKFKKAKFANFNDVLQEGKIPLSKALEDRDRRVFYVDGQNVKTLREASMLGNISEHLTNVVEGAPLGANLWFSAGGVLEKFHYDETSQWICQFMGTQDMSFVSPASTEGMYPVNLADPSMDMDFQLALTSKGKLVDAVIPEEYRDGKLLWSAVNGDPPDKLLFPKFDKVTKLACPLKPGECVWVPSYWWRSTRTIPKEANMAMGFVFGSDLPVNETKFDIKTTGRSYESLAGATDRELRQHRFRSEL